MHPVVLAHALPRTRNVVIGLVEGGKCGGEVVQSQVRLAARNADPEELLAYLFPTYSRKTRVTGWWRFAAEDMVREA